MYDVILCMLLTKLWFEIIKTGHFFFQSQFNWSADFMDNNTISNFRYYNCWISDEVFCEIQHNNVEKWVFLWDVFMK